MGGVLSANDKIAPCGASGTLQSFSNQSSIDQKMAADDEEFVRTKNRSTTDVCFLLFFTTFLIGLLCLMGYCVVNGDVNRVVNGYDNCGSVCGKPRPPLTKDNANLSECYKITPNAEGKYHLILRQKNTVNFDRLCVTDCNQYEGYKSLLNRCVPYYNKTTIGKFFSKTGIQNFFDEVSEDFSICWKEFFYLCLIALGLSLVILVLFRFLVGFVVWIVLIGVVLASIIASVILWILWHQSKKMQHVENDIEGRKTLTYLVFAIIASVVAVIVLFIVIIMRKRIQLVVQLFEEAGKAIASMPALLFEPILTFLSLGAVLALFLYCVTWIESAGHLKEHHANVFWYQKDIWIKLTRWYNLLAMFWMVQFVIGCQHMVIAGAVAQWYFKRDKSQLHLPVFGSAYLLTRYHLGSVALGSFLIALVQFVRAILKYLEEKFSKTDNDCIKCMWRCCQCCLYCFENFLKFWTRNAYIEVAIYGQNFCKAGQTAFKHLASNALRVAAINSIGDFVLFLGKVLVVVATVVIGIEMLKGKPGLQHIWVPVTLAGFFAYFISHCFMTVYEMTIDTIFLCFCEDCEKNDGGSRPYYMSRGLMEFVESSNRAIKEENNKATGPEGVEMTEKH